MKRVTLHFFDGVSAPAFETIGSHRDIKEGFGGLPFVAHVEIEPVCTPFEKMKEQCTNSKGALVIHEMNF